MKAFIEGFIDGFTLGPVRRAIARFFSVTSCKGCAYDDNDMIHQANCLGCFSYDSRPHYTPNRDGVSNYWWEEKKREALK